MTVTYDHNPPGSGRDNPHPLTHDALAAAAGALDAAARGQGPLVRSKQDARFALIPIMGSKLSPSPELHRAGAGVLEVDYADGRTFTWDIDAFGGVEPRRYAYSFALVMVYDEPMSDEKRDELADGLPEGCQFLSGPTLIPYTPDDYDVQPRDERTTR